MQYIKECDKIENINICIVKNAIKKNLNWIELT